MKSEPVRIKDSVMILSNIGEILYLKGKYEESFNIVQRVLTIRKKLYPSGHIDIAIANTLYNIGKLKYEQGKF